MPVSRCKIVSRLLICGMLPAFNLQAKDLSAADLPSIDFLEYLGSIENEIDGSLSSPVELDMEAGLVARNANNEQKNNIKVDSEEYVDE